jgi:hypothetical protein
VPSPREKPGDPDGGFSSQTCSGIIPPSFAAPAIAARCAFAERPASSSYSPRSPAKIGQMRPIVSPVSGSDVSQALPSARSP